jgi:AcrR family transcriptional regulator
VNTAPARRDRYHHGDLARALVTAAVERARAGGPQAVVLREVAREVGVSATSAYRHFANHADLLRAVQQRAQEELATALLADPVPDRTPDPSGFGRLRAQCRNYLRFTQDQPGLFRAAFGQDASAAMSSGSMHVLSDTLDDLVASGRVSPGRRAGAEISVWASVHGLAELLLEGPLSSLEAAERGVAVDDLLDFIVRGLTD